MKKTDEKLAMHLIKGMIESIKDGERLSQEKLQNAIENLILEEEDDEVKAELVILLDVGLNHVARCKCNRKLCFFSGLSDHCMAQHNSMLKKALAIEKIAPLVFFDDKKMNGVRHG